MADFNELIDQEARNDTWTPKGGYKLQEIVQYLNPNDKQWKKNGKVTKVDSDNYSVTDSTGKEVYELSVDKVKSQPSAAGPAQQIQIQFVELAPNASQGDMMTALAKMFAGMTVDPYFLSDDDISKTFEELDADKDGTLSLSEVKAFLHGKYGLDGDNIQRAFNNHAHLHGGNVSISLDKKEFALICHQANDASKAFNAEEDKKDNKYFWWATQGSNIGVGCSICTGCISLCVSSCELQYYAADLQSRRETRERRLNYFLAATLTKPEVESAMTRV